MPLLFENTKKPTVMAIIKDSPLGSLSGKLGDLTFRKNKYGTTTVSKKPDMSRVKPSVVQKFQRSKMKVAMDFLSPLSGLMKDFYMPFRANRAGFDSAKSYIMKEALLNTEEGYVIDYGKAMISFGDLRIPEGIHIHLEEDNEGFDIHLQWEDNTRQAMAYPDDSLLVVIHVPEDGRYIYYRDITQRGSLGASIRLEKYWKTRELQLWMAFVRPDEKRASPSVYLGGIMGMVIS